MPSVSKDIYCNRMSSSPVRNTLAPHKFWSKFLRDIIILLGVVPLDLPENSKLFTCATLHFTTHCSRETYSYQMWRSLIWIPSAPYKLWSKLFKNTLGVSEVLPMDLPENLKWFTCATLQFKPCGSKDTYSNQMSRSLVQIPSASGVKLLNFHWTLETNWMKIYLDKCLVSVMPVKIFESSFRI